MNITINVILIYFSVLIQFLFFYLCVCVRARVCARVCECVCVRLCASIVCTASVDYVQYTFSSQTIVIKNNKTSLLHARKIPSINLIIIIIGIYIANKSTKSIIFVGAIGPRIHSYTLHNVYVLTAETLCQQVWQLGPPLRCGGRQQ